MMDRMNRQEDDNMVVISFAQLVRAVRSKTLLILAAALLFAIIGVFRAHPLDGASYQATASVFYAEEETSEAEHIPSGVSPLSEQTRRTKLYAILLKEHAIIDQVVEELAGEGIQTSYDEISGNLTIEAVTDSPMVKISLTGSDSEKIQTTVERILAHREDVMLGKHTDGEAVIFNEVLISERNNTSVIMKNLIVYGIAGLFAAVLVLLLAEIFRIVLNRTIRSEKELADLMQVPVLAVVPAVGAHFSSKRKLGRHSESGCSKSGRRILISGAGGSRYYEAFRMLFTNLHCGRAGKEGNGRVIMITSALPEEGKTNTAANLAIMMAASGMKVLLLDADLISRTADQVFNAAGHKGLRDVLKGEARAAEAIVWIQDRGIDFMPAGSEGPESDIPALLNTSGMKELLEELRRRYDYIIVDSNSVNLSADVSETACLCDECVLVVSHDSTTKENLAACREQLGHLSVPLAGTVLNMYNPEKDSSESIIKYYSL